MYRITGEGSVKYLLHTKAYYIRKCSLGRPKLICQSLLTCQRQIQYGGRFEYRKCKLQVNQSGFAVSTCLYFKESCLQEDYELILFHCSQIMSANNYSVCNWTRLIQTQLFPIPCYFELKTIWPGFALLSYLLSTISNSHYFKQFIVSPCELEIVGFNCICNVKSDPRSWKCCPIAKTAV